MSSGTHVKQKVIRFISKMDGYVIFAALVSAFSLSYYFNPLDNIELTDWDRIFSPAIMAGISIDQRITNYYLLFFLYLPIVSIFLW